MTRGVPVIIPYRQDMSHGDMELKFALRSVDANLDGVSDVIIVGDAVPDWLVGVSWYKVPDESGNADTNILRKLSYVLDREPGIDRFILMADDNVVAGRLKADRSFPVVRNCRGSDKFPFSVYTNRWGRRMHATFDWIGQMGWPVPDCNWDSHCPQMFSAENIRGHIGELPLDTEYGVCSYTALRMLEYDGKPPMGVPQSEVKRTITHKDRKQPYFDKLFLGYDDSGWNEDLICALADRFTRSSRWEMPDYG